MPIDFSQVKEIAVPEGTVKQITDVNGTVLWKKPTLYRKLVSFGWWNNDANSWNKGIAIPTDILFPNEYLEDFDAAVQVYRSQTRYSPLFSNWLSGNGHQIAIFNVNQNGAGSLTFEYNDGTYTGNYKTIQLDANAWSSSIRPEQVVYFWSNTYSSSNFLRMRRGDANSSYTCETAFYSALGNQTSYALDTKLATNPPKGAERYLHFFCQPNATDSTQHFCGQFYRFRTFIRTNPMVYTHDLYPAQRKSDNRIGLYDAVTNKFYPDVNNYLNSNYHLQVGAVLEENPEGWAQF